ncbi:MAG: LCP family protein [Halanaerobiales bacterium]|nr:LCP family protein [Halanaerobiales bacterium]
MLKKFIIQNWKYILLFTIIFIILSTTAYILLNDDFSLLDLNPFRDSKLNILVAGYDSSINGPPRADTIIVASVNLNTNQVGLLFIPRDTRVEINGHGYNRINASHAYGGIELLNETVEDFLSIKLDYFVETDFKGFEKIIDLIGGIDLHIEKPLHYIDEAGGLNINLSAGDVHLNGERALQYVRFRGDKLGDIGRVSRQQKFVDALINKATSSQNIIKLPSIYKEVMNSVNTNIPLQDIKPFVELAKNVELDKVTTEMVPGRPEYINGASYWIAEKKSLDILVNNLIRSKEFIENNKYQITILNGNGVSGTASNLSEELQKYGFKINKIGNADNYNYEKTIIYYKGLKGNADGIQEIIGGRIEKKEDIDNDLQIILGKDYLNNDKTIKEENS